MNTAAIKNINNPNLDELNNLIIDAIQDIKGKNILKFDLRNLSEAPTDFFIICEGESNIQVKSIASNIEKRLKEELNIRVNHAEGYGNATWVLLDYFNTVVHVFYPEARQFYDLESLWGDAKISEHNLD